LVEDEVEPLPVKVAPVDQEVVKQSESEQSPTQGSCSQSLADVAKITDSAGKKTEEWIVSPITHSIEANLKIDAETPCLTPCEDEGEEEGVPSEEEDSSPKSSEGTSPTSKMCWADFEEDDDEFMMRLIQKQRPLTQSELALQELEQTVTTPEQPESQELVEQPEVVVQQKQSGESGPQKGPRKPSLLATVKTLGAQGKLEDALAAIDKAADAGMAKRTQLLNALLDSLVHGGHATLASNLFEQMKIKEDVDTVTYNIVLRSWLSQNRDIAEVKALLREMTGLGLAANAVTFNELLSDRARAGDRPGIWGLISKMCAAGGIGVNKVSLTILLKSLDDSTSVEEIKRVVFLLERLEEPVDEVLRAAAAEACVRLKEPGRISEVMELLIESGGCEARPSMSAATYGGLIKAHGRAHDLKGAWETWKTMMRNSVQPTSITTGCMVEALVANGTVDDAWTLVQEMIADEKQCDSINTVIYSTVLKGFAHAWKLERCFDVLGEMQCHGIQCNTITYNTLLDACTKCGSMDRVSEVFGEMQRNAVEPDLITYSTLVKGFCRAGDLERAFDLVQDVKQDGSLKLDEIVYNSLLDGCARQQKVDQAMEVLSDMRTADIVPSNYTLSILVKLLGRARRLKQAFALVEDLCGAYNIRLNVQVYTCLIQACLQNQKIDRALAVHDEMVQGLGREPDCKAYSVLLSGCLRANALDEAMHVALCAYRLPGHGLAVPDRTPEGPCPGAEEDVLSNLDWQFKSSQKAHLLEALGEIKKASGFSGFSNSKWSGRRQGQGKEDGGRRQNQGKGHGRGRWH
jgi:pentatricopeptide repeat protein